MYTNFPVLVNVTLMLVGSYTAIIVLTKDKSVDFDTATLIYMFTEPSVTGSIIIFDFARKQKQFFKSIELLERIDCKLKQMGLKRNLAIVKWELTVFYTFLVLGNLLYNTFSYMGGKPVIHSVFEYMSYGISFHVQNVIILYYFTFGALVLQNFVVINRRLEAIVRPVRDVERMVQELQGLGEIHFDLCEALKAINVACSKTMFLYNMRAFVEVCAWLLSLNGLLPKLRTDFTMMIMCYVTTVIYSATVSEILRNVVSFSKYIQSEALHCICLPLYGLSSNSNHKNLAECRTLYVSN